MPDISISINDSAARAVINRAPDRIGIAMRAAMTDATSYVIARARKYPPERPGSTYVRTNTLMRSWSARIEGGGIGIRGIVGSNGNTAPYNRLVMSRRDQKRIHRGWWSTIEDIAEQGTPTVQRFFADRLAAAGLDR